MRKPLIAITPQYDLDMQKVKIEPSYMRAVKEFGGIPILLPLYNEADDLADLIDYVDGIIYSGGPDVNPLMFFEDAIIGCKEIIKERDELELNLLPIILKKHKPILGICRGIQTMNIALGGDIYQDIVSQTQSQIGHYQKAKGNNPTHMVHIDKNSMLYEIVGKEEIAVNSFHHQAIRAVANQLEVAAYSKDGLVEAVTMKKYPFFLGVQWHPESLYTEDEMSCRIFGAFIKACKKEMEHEYYKNK